MRRVFFLLLMMSGLIISRPASAQIRNIPSEVTDSLKARYPAASKVAWRDKISYFQAVFVMDTSNYEARFNRKGEWVSTEKTIGPTGLPPSVKDGLAKSKYADWKVRSVFILYLPGNIIQYHVLAYRSDLQKRNLLFSPEGQLLKDNITL